MLYRRIIYVYYENHKNDFLLERNAAILNGESGGTHRNYCASEG
jgi:hypothetical protein